MLIYHDFSNKNGIPMLLYVFPAWALVFFVPGVQHWPVRYISKPLLLDGYKFDLRLYVLVSGCDPLRIFLHRWSSQRWAAVWGKKLPCTRQESSCSPTRLYILHESGLEVWKILWSSYLEMCKTIEPKLNSSHDDVLPCCSCTHAVTTRMQSGQMIELVSSDRPS